MLKNTFNEASNAVYAQMQAKNPEAGLKKWEKKALRAQNGQAAKPQEATDLPLLTII